MNERLSVTNLSSENNLPDFRHDDDLEHSVETPVSLFLFFLKWVTDDLPFVVDSSKLTQNYIRPPVLLFLLFLSGSFHHLHIMLLHRSSDRLNPNSFG